MKSNKSVKKVFLLIPSMLGGGAERVLSILANELAKDNSLKIYLITLEQGEDYDISANIRRKFLSNLHGHASKIKKTYFFFIQLFNLFKIVKKEKPDIVIAFLKRAIVLNILISSIFHYKTISSLRSNSSQELKLNSFLIRVLFNNLYKLLLNKSNFIVSLSESVRQDAIRNFGVKEDKVITIYNPYDHENIKSLANQPLPEGFNNFFRGSKVISTVGRLSKSKNFEQLIDIFFDLSKEYKDLKLCILGVGPLENLLKNKVEQLNLNNCVLFTGFQKNPFIFLKHSKLFAFTSLREGFGNAIVEAMICGLPVITYDCPSGPKEIIQENKYGFLIDVNDTKHFKDKIRLLLDNDQIYQHFKEQSIKRGLDFTKDKFINQFKELL